MATVKGSKLSPEHREKMRQAKLGKRLTPEHRENIRQGILRHDYKGDKNPNWKGEDAGYIAHHMRIYKFGKPSLCEHCGTTTAKRFEWANISKEYKMDRSDWLRLCVSCHIKFDKTA
jgi:hypothetical protein